METLSGKHMSTLMVTRIFFMVVCRLCHASYMYIRTTVLPQNSRVVPPEHLVASAFLKSLGEPVCCATHCCASLNTLLSRTGCQSSSDNPHCSSRDASSSPGAHSGSSIHSYCVPWDARAWQATQLRLQALQGTPPLVAQRCMISTSQCRICLLVSLSHSRVDRPESSR